jgi:hypothetical protein
MIICILPVSDGVHMEKAIFYQCVPTGNTSESTTPCPWWHLLQRHIKNKLKLKYCK